MFGVVDGVDVGLFFVGFGVGVVFWMFEFELGEGGGLDVGAPEGVVVGVGVDVGVGVGVGVGEKAADMVWDAVMFVNV